MSRCRNCNYEFEEENGWQEFCSVLCAQDYVVGDRLKSKNGKVRAKATERWAKWFEDKKNNRLVRRGAQAEKPKIGTQVDGWRICFDDGVWTRHKVKLDVSGYIGVRPITEHEKKQIENQRGRESFGANMIPNQPWHKLPGSRNMVGLGWFPHDE